MVALVGYSDIAASAFLNYARGTAMPFSAGFHLALLTSATVPQEDGTGVTEISDTLGYLRRPMLSYFGTTTSSQNNNTTAVTFGPCSGGNWVNVRYVGQMTTSGAGTGSILKIADMITPFTVAIGQSLTFPIGAMQDLLA